MSILQYRTVRVEENLCKQLGADPAYTKMLTHSAKFRWHFFSLYPWHKWFSLWSLNVRWFFIKRTMAFFSRTRSDRVLVPYRNEPPNICLIWDTMTMHGFVQCRNTDHGDTFVTQRSRSQIFIRPLFHTTSPNLSSNSCHYFLITSFNNLLGFWGWNMKFLLL